jgi:hypothetical protein
MLDLVGLCAKLDIALDVRFVVHDCFISRARNILAGQFLASDATHLLYIDDDIGFTAESVLAMLAYQSDDSPYDVLAAPYPWKRIAWNKALLAMQSGTDPMLLSRCALDYVFNGLEQRIEMDWTDPVEVAETGGGFMMIRRRTLETFPDYGSFVIDDSAEFNGTSVRSIFQDAACDDGRYLSEDYRFCRTLRQTVGGRVWLAPGVTLHHVGQHVFGA